ncbi:hypothetical protein KKH23_04905 [Patescibacteria group bacterium]|nr:hypothetical protein [Patescibacteria group bacterium]MBU1067260.1 hypothetical protein [Patescibacteria group bacterium]
MEGRLVITNTLMPAHRPISTGFVQVVSVSNDYLTCVWVDPPTSTTGDTVYVAKPFALMVSPFDGETVLYNNGQSVSYSYVTERQRGATSGAHEEIQSVTPDYFVGEELRVVSGETGALDFYGAWLVWQDLNTAGRHWAAEPT